MPDTKAPNRLREIRMMWSVVGRRNLVDEPIDGGVWCPDTPAARRDLEIIVAAGNEAYGLGSHWIVERDA